jgi:PAS domain S-box-containing protein
MALLGPLQPRSDADHSALASQFRASVPPVFLFVGIFYAVFSGAIFLGDPASWKALMWGVTAALGLTLAAVGRALRTHQMSDTALVSLAAGFAVALVWHDLAIIFLASDAGQASFVAMLLAGTGYFIVDRRALAAAHLASAAGWVVAARAIGEPLMGSGTGFFAAGIIVGWAANLMRTRIILGHVQATMAASGDLQASEERFRSLAETAQDGILLLDDQGRITYLNPAGLRLFGLKPHEAAGRFLSQHLGAEATSPTALLGTHEMTAQRRDGATFAAELSLARTERDGKVAFTGVLRDVSERKKAQAATQEAVAREAEVGRLREMNEFKTRFLNMAAHELNTPLTPLRLQLHLLKAEQMGPLSEKQAKAIALLDRNVTRLSGLVGELLEVARLQSGRLRLQLSPVSLDEIVDEVLESFGEAARRVGIALSYAGHQGLVAQADRNRTTQVLFNLVSNALKFTPAGGRVTVEADDHGDRIEVAVTDTGLGLTPEQQSRLFQPFNQVHDPMAVTVSGTGLGLYICKGLVEAQGGQVSVSSAGPGLGSTFRFTLPTAQAQAAAVRPEVAKPADQDPLVRRLRELI